MPRDIDRVRARDLFAAAGIDTLVVTEPEAFQYVTGVDMGVAGLFRRAGAGFALIPADPSIPLAAVIGDLAEAQFRAMSSITELRTHPLWIETADPLDANLPIERAIASGWKATRPIGFSRPATFDLGKSLNALEDLLRVSGLRNGRIGFDFDFVPVNDAAIIRRKFDSALVCDGSPAFNRLRMVKTGEEIAILRLAGELAEAGIAELARETRADQSAEQLRQYFRAGVEAEASRRSIKRPSSWEYISIGPDPWSSSGRTRTGAVIKVDVGCIVDGYSSDTSRNFIFGAADESQQRIHTILEYAFDVGLSSIAPGRRLADVHTTVTTALEDAGLKGFRRGHFGHGLGLSAFSEQWPFIAADSEICFEPGMVMAFEVPLYVTGIGGFNIENQILVTREGTESMNKLPRSLISIGKANGG